MTLIDTAALYGLGGSVGNIPLRVDGYSKPVDEESSNNNNNNSAAPNNSSRVNQFVPRAQPEPQPLSTKLPWVLLGIIITIVIVFIASLVRAYGSPDVQAAVAYGAMEP
ncbi:CUN034 hypothetical protein [Culex nigripalpus nucleopolyhedrovirus]|uniref:Uncharacterized protein n=1 Tax=Culex nigripalpus nucleopolyhedrovirus (isolate Florida/1997) TaxID=645993 RepID=Q919N5_NPVCO|nr:CUN034 hypothetical protein [Culex nigripalpus nucleopolyhedrovirus]AAK94112.1 CUN034 hypothetical protein [Culex nigripalpus nucleopolyhedrovirus]